MASSGNHLDLLTHKGLQSDIIYRIRLQTSESVG